MGGLITGVEPGSLANALGVCPGDVLLTVNGEQVADIIDVQYYAAEPVVTLGVERGGQTLTLTGDRAGGQLLGLDFAHPTFDVDVRRCNNQCEFCFVTQMPPNLRSTLYIKDDDYRYSFLYGHYVTLTNLAEHDYWRIVNQRLSPLYVSVHATDDDRRRHLLRNPDALSIMEQLAWLVEEGIELHTQIVVVPDLNDGVHLVRSVHDLATLYPGVRSVSVVPVGLTRYHRHNLRINTHAEAEAILDACQSWQTAFRASLGVNFVYPTDEWYLFTGRPIPPTFASDGLELQENGLGCVRRFLDAWQETRTQAEGMALFDRPAHEGVVLVSGTLFAPVLADHARELAEVVNIPIEVIPISNNLLGETVTVAGLLTAEDVVNQLLARAEPLGDIIVLPRVMFDHPDLISLDNYSPADVARALGRPVALADLMVDVLDAIYSTPAQIFQF